MNTAALHPGDLIEVDKRGVRFTARVVSVIPSRRGRQKLIKIAPLNPKRYTWRYCTALEVRERVEMQERLEVGA